MRFFRSENGNAAIEYAVLLGVIGAGLFMAMVTLQSALGANLDNSVAHLSQAGTSAAAVTSNESSHGQGSSHANGGNGHGNGGGGGRDH